MLYFDTPNFFFVAIFILLFYFELALSLCVRDSILNKMINSSSEFSFAVANQFIRTKKILSSFSNSLSWTFLGIFCHFLPHTVQKLKSLMQNFIFSVVNNSKPISIFILSLRLALMNTPWKSSKYRVYSGRYFPVFGLSTGKYGPEKIRYLDTFRAVEIVFKPN